MKLCSSCAWMVGAL